MRVLLRLAGASILVGSVLSCHPRANDRGAQRSDVDRAQVKDTLTTLASLVDSLRHIHGRIEDHPPATWSFEGDSGLFSAIAHHSDSAVVSLVECLGDTSLSATEYHGHRVAVGLVCYAALSNVAYSEVDDSGDWPGAVLPTVSASELLKAREAWRAVIRDHAYRLL